MKKLFSLFLIVLAVTLTGCAAMEKQKKIDAQMENLVFNAPAAEVYNAAVGVMKSAMWVDVKSTGNNKGASDWAVKDSVLGGKKYQEKTRVRVEVAKKGNNKSTIRIYTERTTNFMGKFDKPTVGRAKHYEYLTLQKIDNVKAAEIEKKASK